ncbi:unnamed protein product, partial [Ectocarpus sp. 12 AP-2014]
MTPYLEAILTLAAQCWSDHMEEVVPLVETIAINLPEEVTPHVPTVVVPLLLKSLQHPTVLRERVTRLDPNYKEVTKGVGGLPDVHQPSINCTPLERRADKRLAMVLRAVLVMRPLLNQQLSIVLPALVNLVGVMSETHPERDDLEWHLACLRTIRGLTSGGALSHLPALAANLVHAFVKLLSVTGGGGTDALAADGGRHPAAAAGKKMDSSSGGISLPQHLWGFIGGASLVAPWDLGGGGRSNSIR